MLFRHDLAAAVQTALPKAGTESAADPQSTSEAAAPGRSGFVVERPAPGLARGKYSASPLVIGLLGAALVLGALLYYFFRFRKPRS